MVAHRVRIARDKAPLVQALVDTKDTTSPFQTYADVLVFAASLGVKRRKRVVLDLIAKEPAPISMEVFLSRGYDAVLKLIAIATTANPQILTPSNPDIETQRIEIFEEYANGGLEILQDELRGAIDYTEQILLILSGERFPETKSQEEFDLSRFL